MNNLVVGDRNQAVEALRIAAAFGVVYFHAHAPGWQVAYAGLVVFLALSPMFEVGANLHKSKSITSIAWLYLAPWALWFVVYAAWQFLQREPIFHSSGNFATAVLAGTSKHLWFLPFMFLVVLALRSIKKLVPSVAMLWMASIAAAGMILIGAEWHASFPAPYAQWAFAAPAVLIGIALGAASHVVNGRWALLPVAVAMLYSVGDADSIAVFAYPIGIGLLAGAVWFGSRLAFGNVTKWSGMMLGVYLVHSLALALSQKLLGRGSVPTVMAAFALSLIAVLAWRMALAMLKTVMDRRQIISEAA